MFFGGLAEFAVLKLAGAERLLGTVTAQRSARTSATVVAVAERPDYGLVAQ